MRLIDADVLKPKILEYVKALERISIVMVMILSVNIIMGKNPPI